MRRKLNPILVHWIGKDFIIIMMMLFSCNTRFKPINRNSYMTMPSHLPLVLACFTPSWALGVAVNYPSLDSIMIIRRSVPIIACDMQHNFVLACGLPIYTSAFAVLLYYINRELILQSYHHPIIMMGSLLRSPRKNAAISNNCLEH